MLCIYYIRKSGQPQCRSDKLFMKYPLSAGMARRTDGKRPADRCDHAALAEHIAQQRTQVHNDNSMGINGRKDEETMDNQGGVPKWK